MAMRLAVLGTIPSDAHSWNLIFMEKFLREKGLEVLNLGPCTPIAEFVQVAVEAQPAMAVVSTVNGHGALEGLTLANAFRGHPLTAPIPLFLGGKCSSNAKLTPAQAKALREAGFTELFHGQDSLERFKAWLPLTLAQEAFPSHSSLRSPDACQLS